MGAPGLAGNPRGTFVVYFSVAVAVIDTLAFALRIVARFQVKAAFAADDWWIVGSLIPLYLMIGAGAARTSPYALQRIDPDSCCLVTSAGGLGRSMHDLSAKELSTFLKVGLLVGCTRIY